MRVEAATLANYAELRGSLVTIVGGGCEDFTAPAFPARFLIYVAGVIAREPDEMDDDWLMEVFVVDPQQTEHHVDAVTFGTLHVGTAPGVPARTGFATRIELVTEGPGVWTVLLRHDGDDLVSLPFEVK